jgi:hypothetical protein
LGDGEAGAPDGAASAPMIWLVDWVEVSMATSITCELAVDELVCADCRVVTLVLLASVNSKL